jgi:hypothetical protein
MAILPERVSGAHALLMTAVFVMCLFVFVFAAGPFAAARGNANNSAHVVVARIENSTLITI